MRGTRKQMIAANTSVASLIIMPLSKHAKCKCEAQHDSSPQDGHHNERGRGGSMAVRAKVRVDNLG